MDILDPFWGPQTPMPRPKVTIYLPFEKSRTLSDLLKTLLFWPHFSPFWDPLRVLGRRLRLDPCTAAFGLEDLFGPFQTHAWPSNFVFDTFPHLGPFEGVWGVSEMPFWPYFDCLFEDLRAQTMLLAKCAYLFPLSEGIFWGDLREIWPYFAHFGTPLRVLREAAALPPVRAAFGLEDLLRASQTHARDLNFWSFWPLFLSIEKVNFVILPIRGQWNAILTLFWPHFEPPEQTFWPLAKCAYLFPLSDGPWRDLEGPYFDPFLTIFWTPLRVLRRLRLGPAQAAFWAEGPVWTFSNPCLTQILVILTTFPIGPLSEKNDPILTSFWPLNPWPKCAILFLCPEGRGPLRDSKFLT